MSVSGEVYAEVEASVVNNGISPMAMISGSPEPVDGSAYVVVWIRWRYDSETGEGGYTGTGWHFDDPNNGLQSYGTEDNFKNWLKTENPKNLNEILETWDATAKAAFLNKHLSELEASNCLYFTANT